ncbi:MAG TPA: SRPBCC domain-containing protein [Gaiellaceae bacterium]|nr:SRPBCC domain-containing protein [Gaiellaceae bacterium]
MNDLDRIERQMTFEVPREDVWAAITEPELLSRWFGTSAELDLRRGARARSTGSMST